MEGLRFRFGFRVRVRVGGPSKEDLSTPSLPEDASSAANMSLPGKSYQTYPIEALHRTLSSKKGGLYVAASWVVKKKR